MAAHASPAGRNIEADMWMKKSATWSVLRETISNVLRGITVQRADCISALAYMNRYATSKAVTQLSALRKPPSHSRHPSPCPPVPVPMRLHSQHCTMTCIPELTVLWQLQYSSFTTQSSRSTEKWHASGPPSGPERNACLL